MFQQNSVGPAGGGGGAGGVGGNATSNTAGNGGIGASNSITGSPVTYASGGGGGIIGKTAGTASDGGGGGSSSGTGAAGRPNTGGGGGGGGGAIGAGGAGGSGIVIIRHPSSIAATGGTITTVGGDTVHTFTSNGTFTITGDGTVQTTDGATRDPIVRDPIDPVFMPWYHIAAFDMLGNLSHSSVIHQRDRKIGIGTSTPASTLHVDGDLTISKGDTTYLTTETNTYPMIFFKSPPYGNPGRFGRIGLYGDTAFLSDNAFFNLTNWVADDSTKARSIVMVQQGNILFQTQLGDVPTGMINRMRVAPNGDVSMAYTGGNVGIGTNTPSAKLHVVGDVVVEGNIAAKYQDIAEWVPATAAEPAGTVLVARRGVLNLVERSMRSYDTSVVGVVSPQPGIVLGEPAPDKVLVAHSGRVRVKADASYGPIEAGDLLVTSPIPGFAMRSEPLAVGGGAFHRPGTLLGKALEPLASGKGEILVLLTLQ
jgi:hypothetical protein